MGKVYESDLTIRGFRFLGGSGDDAARFDPADVVADRDGEIVYEPGMVKCFEEVRKGFESIAQTNSGFFTCFPKTYIFRDFYPVIKDWRTGQPEGVVGERQRNGYAIAMDRISRMPDADKRVEEYAKVASVMAMAGWEKETKAVTDEIFNEITSVDDGCEQREMIRAASQIVSENVHVDGLAAPILGRLLDAAETMIDHMFDYDITMSLVIARMKAEGCEISDREHAAAVSTMNISNYVGLDGFSARAEVARNLGNAGFQEYSVMVYDKMISDLFESEYPALITPVLKKLFSDLRASGLGDMEHPILDRAISVIGKIGTDVEKAEAIRSAAYNMTPAIKDPNYEVHFDRLKEIAAGIEDSALRGQAMGEIRGRESYVYEW